MYLGFSGGENRGVSDGNGGIKVFKFYVIGYSFGETDT